MILYILLSGYPPFNGPNDKAIMEAVGAGNYDFDGPEWRNISNEGKNFIRKMLQYDPAKRISTEQAIQDPWIKKYNSDKNAVDEPLINNALLNMSKFRVQNLFNLKLKFNS